jgi:hypothetical protein
MSRKADYVFQNLWWLCMTRTSLAIRPNEDFMNMTIEREKIGVRSRQSARGLRMGLLGLVCLAAVSGAASAADLHRV